MLAPHQSEAVERALELLERRGGLLLADEPGLGKSFVAAEVLRRWTARFGGEVELVVPAGLVAQWRETLAQFGVAAPIVTHETMARARFVAVPGKRLVVVDEAHVFRNPRTRRYAGLARRAAASCVLLISATPVCNALADLHALLRLLARDDVLAGTGVMSIDAAFEARDHAVVERIVAELVIRRDRGVLPADLEFGILERRVIRHFVPTLPLLNRLAFPLVGGAEIVRRLLLRRLESSGSALAESLRRQRRFYQRALSALAAGRELPKRDYRRAFGHEEDAEVFQEVLFWELFAPAAAGRDPRLLRDEIETIEHLLEDLAAMSDAKRELLLELLKGASEPALLFTGAAATARDLHTAVTAAGRRCGLVTSRERSLERVVAAFRAGLLDVIVATDMAAEGLNLQRAGLVVHYDLPWNPVKLDQRNGRAHRIGQTRDRVRAVYFVPESRVTGVVATVARKNRVRRRALAAGVVDERFGLPTLRARLTRDSAYLELAAAAPFPLPEVLARRHKAGIELVMREMSKEYLDPQRIDELVALVRSGV